MMVAADPSLRKILPENGDSSHLFLLQWLTSTYRRGSCQTCRKFERMRMPVFVFAHMVQMEMRNMQTINKNNILL